MSRTLASLVSLCIAAATLPAAEFDIRSIRNGSWSEPATWKPRAPRAGDRVFISPGTVVVYDADSDDVIRSVLVAGVLRFARDRTTRLEVGNVRIQPGGSAAEGAGVEDVHAHERPEDEAPEAALEVGSPGRPIPRPYRARIRLHFLQGMHRDNEPALVCRPGGRMDFHGAPLSRSWVKLGEDAKGGDRAVVLAEPVTGWRAGDEIIVTSTRHRSPRGSFRRRLADLGTEERVIERIDGRKLTLDRPLERDHAGSGLFRAEVADLSRTVVVESAEPDGVRGHTMYHRFSRGGISYARFAHLGKEGVLGRYSIHFHRVRDSMRGSSVVGAAIVDSHNRWITIHSTEYLVVRDCVGFRSVGHGFFLEDGTEVYNVLDRNLGVQAFIGKRLPRQVLPFDPNDGAAFWFPNGRNTLVRNVSCENDRYGFRYDMQRRSNFDSRLPILMPDGKREVVDVRELPLFRFEDNEAHAEGLYGVALAGTDGAGPDARHPHIVRNLRIWETHYGLRSQLPTMWIESVRIHRAAYGIYRPWFENHVYRDLHISFTNAEPFNRGLDDRSTQHGRIAVDGLTFEGVRHNSHVPLIQLSANNASGDAESHFRDVRIVGRLDRNRRALVNLGGGPRLDPQTEKGVPIYIHDYYGPGKHARIVSTRAKDWRGDGNEYREDPPLTGDESRVAEVEGVEFPELLDPVDDLPPATIITSPREGVPVEWTGGALVVEGTSTDNEAVRRVVVNGTEASDVEYGFHRWRAELHGAGPGRLTLEAHAVDAAGNIEVTGHRITIELRKKLSETRGARRTRI